MAQGEDGTADQIPAGTSREWHFHPALPIAMSPVFDLPPKPKAALAWLLGTWTRLTPPVSHMTCALLVYFLLWPNTETMQTSGAGWVAQLLMITFGAVILFASALHF